MKRIFIFPSIDEAKEFLLTGTKAPVFVAGGSTAEMAACIVRAVRSKRARHPVLAGLRPPPAGAPAPRSPRRRGGERRRAPAATDR